MDGKLSLAPRRDFFSSLQWNMESTTWLSVVDKDLKVDNHANRCAHFSVVQNSIMKIFRIAQWMQKRNHN